MSIDHPLHSLFESPRRPQILVRYGRYFQMNTYCFRGGCLTGPTHRTELHGFLAYLVKCVVHENPYRIFGYQGKQVRDNIHSYDLVTAFWEVYQKPMPGGRVYNMGGGVHSNCSMLEAISFSEALAGKKLQYTYEESNRKGDHIWWISDVRNSKRLSQLEIPVRYQKILAEIYESREKVATQTKSRRSLTRD